MPLEDYTQAVARHVGREVDEDLRAACEIVQEKAQTLEEVWPLIRFLFGPPVEDEKAWRKFMQAETRPLLESARTCLAGASGFDAASVEDALAPLPEKLDVKPGRLFQPIRVAITGGAVSPGIFESLAALGRERSLARMDDAIMRLHGTD
jgi:glutamyl-tRNA synthetase